MKIVAVEWKDGGQAGVVEVTGGQLTGLSASVEGNRFACRGDGPCRIEISIDQANTGYGADPTMVTLRAERNPFTFLLRDVARDFPIYIPEYGVVVTEADDPRSYAEIEDAIRSNGLRTGLQKIAAEPEESYADAEANCRALTCPIWLGLGRDMRIFQVTYTNDAYWQTIEAKHHGYDVPLPEKGGQPSSYQFTFGRGLGCTANLRRRIEDRELPIIRGEVVEDEVVYSFTSFAGLEYRALTEETLRGTHYLVADGHGHGHMFTPEQQARYDSLLPEEINRDEETVLYTRVQAVNTASVPCYAWFRSPTPYDDTYMRPVVPEGAFSLDGETGLVGYASGRSFAVVKLNGRPAPKEELAVLLQPGETASFEFYMPHSPISEERALALAGQDFDRRHDECRAFWQARLSKAAQVRLPEKQVENRLRAGLLHLDVVAYGLEPDGAVAPTIGVYCPIGSESSPIIQSMDSMGWHELAERSLGYFLEKQHEDGFIQNFGGYMLETGAALWSMGEHFRYTGDKAWVTENAPRFVKACDYLLAWRERNLREDLRGRGYGMIDGKVADPEDPYHAFMLNGFAYVGMVRTVEMLSAIGNPEADRLSREAQALKADILTAVSECLAKSPVVPLGDGSWCPSMPPWAEGRGPVGLLIDQCKWFTHGAFAARDSLVGPLYLVVQEVLDACEQSVTWMLGYHNEMMHVRNVALSQPYYSPHPYIHLKRGEVKAFLKAYYNGFAGLADRETYTFWEHYHHASPHKTHEEGWFLMQTRWMLYMEDGDALRLLPGIPRAWMEHGKSISITDAATYFGPVSFTVDSQVDLNWIVAHVECASDRKPSTVYVRLPHPRYRKPVAVAGGAYDVESESVRIDSFQGSADIVVEF